MLVEDVEYACSLQIVMTVTMTISFSIMQCHFWHPGVRCSMTDIFCMLFPCLQTLQKLVKMNGVSHIPQRMKRKLGLIGWMLIEGLHSVRPTKFQAWPKASTLDENCPAIAESNPAIDTFGRLHRMLRLYICASCPSLNILADWHQRISPRQIHFAKLHQAMPGFQMHNSNVGINGQCLLATSNARQRPKAVVLVACWASPTERFLSPG